MESEELVREINKDLAVILPVKIAMDELLLQLGYIINKLIQTDFQKLIAVLYRVDVSEVKLKQLLQQQPEQDAGKIIAALIIERQLEKIKTRRHFSQQNNDFTGEEKW